jgi:hypothetical protein
MCFGSKEYLQIEHMREQSTKSRAVIIDQDADANLSLEKGPGYMGGFWDKIVHQNP